MARRQIIFHENRMEILQYEFHISIIRENPSIEAHQINEVNLRTHPPTIVINNNEVIFIEDRQKHDFIDFVKRNKIKVEDRFDIWEAINEDFLETEFTEHHKEKTLLALEENGISRTEVGEIREKIKDLMSGWASVTWDYEYLGHYDLLLNKKEPYLTHFPRDFYWWTMEVALRNYQKV